MKNQAAVSICLAALFTAGIASLAGAQDLAIPEPEFVGNFVLVTDDHGLALEKQRASTHARAGFFKAKGSNIVQGAQSTVRAPGGAGLRFIVRASSNDVDPAQLVNVFALTSDPKRDYRYIETSSQGMFTGDSMKIDFIGFSGKRYGDSSYLLTIDRPLPQGEYAMTLEGSRDVFNLFGVD